MAASRVRIPPSPFRTPCSRLAREELAPDERKPGSAGSRGSGESTLAQASATDAQDILRFVIRTGAVVFACDVPALARIAMRIVPRGAFGLIVRVKATLRGAATRLERGTDRHSCLPTDAGGVAQTLTAPEPRGGLVRTTWSAIRCPCFAEARANGLILI